MRGQRAAGAQWFRAPAARSLNAVTDRSNALLGGISAHSGRRLSGWNPYDCRNPIAFVKNDHKPFTPLGEIV